MPPLILITNDDGVFSPGLLAAAEAVADLGELLIVAPRVQQTSMSRALPWGDSIGVIEEVILTVGGSAITAYAVTGSPSLCVIHAVYEIAATKPSLCISGINYGENIGMALAISGTVGAALEASLCRIPALAVSLEVDARLHRSDDYGVVDWTAARHFTRRFALNLLKRGLPSEIAVVNVNVPGIATPVTDVRATVQSRQPYYYFVRAAAARDRGQAFRLPVAPAFDAATLQRDDDIQGLIVDRVVTVTPLTDNLTTRLNPAEWFSQFDGRH